MFVELMDVDGANQGAYPSPTIAWANNKMIMGAAAL